MPYLLSISIYVMGCRRDGSEDPVVLVCIAGSDSSFIKTSVKEPYSLFYWVLSLNKSMIFGSILALAVLCFNQISIKIPSTFWIETHALEHAILIPLHWCKHFLQNLSPSHSSCSHYVLFERGWFKKKRKVKNQIGIYSTWYRHCTSVGWVRVLHRHCLSLCLVCILYVNEKCVVSQGYI